MSDQPAMELLPYYREYLDQILKPRVVRLVEEVRASLVAHTWNQLLERMAEDQNAGVTSETLHKMRVLLEQTLGLKVSVQMTAEFSDGPVARPSPVQNGEQVRRADHVDVIDRGEFPDNPLARAVGGMRRSGR